MLKRLITLFSIFAIVTGIVSFTSWAEGTAGAEQHGLKAKYFKGMNLNRDTSGQPVLERTDPNIKFNWFSGSPGGKVPADKFSVRWTGQIMPRYSEEYTFYINSDNGRRLWIDGKLIIDGWFGDWNVEYSGKTTRKLDAGKKYDIVVEYFEDVIGASISLEWSSASQVREIVPTSCLYPEISSTVAQPAIFFNNGNVILVCPTEGAEIRYTTNGTMPDKSSNLYSGPFLISSVERSIRVIAYKNIKNSSLTEKPPPVDAPTADPAGGVFVGSKTVTLKYPSYNSKITMYYTEDGSNPTDSGSKRNKYTDKITIDESETLKAVAFNNDTGAFSNVSTYKFVIDALEGPKSSLPSGTYTGQKSVVLSTSTSGAVIYYTQNGSNPTNKSTAYTGPINISTTQVLKAVAYYNNTYSDVSTFNYTFKAVPAPTASIASGTFDNDGNTTQYVILTCEQKDADIFFTLDGTEPTKLSMKYISNPIEIIDTVTLKAVACYNEVLSDVSTYNYTIKKKSRFIDLDNYTWAKDQIESLAAKNIIKGTSETMFSPGAQIKRADFMCLLVRTLNLSASVDSNFSDVKTDDYFYNDIGVLKSLGICTGVGNNKIKPNSLITRQDMMVLISRALQKVNKLSLNGEATDLEKYGDASDISEYAQLDVASLIKDGIVQGNGGSINPKGTATRAETAVIMYRILNK